MLTDPTTSVTQKHVYLRFRFELVEQASFFSANILARGGTANTKDILVPTAIVPLPLVLAYIFALSERSRRIHFRAL